MLQRFSPILLAIALSTDLLRIASQMQCCRKPNRLPKSLYILVAWGNDRLGVAPHIRPHRTPPCLPPSACVTPIPSDTAREKHSSNACLGLKLRSSSIHRRKSACRVSRLSETLDRKND